MGKKILLDAVTANTTGVVFDLQAAIRVPLNSRLRTDGVCSITIYGITNATGKLLGGATKTRLSLVAGGTVTADATIGLSALPSFIRADVEDYVAGTITIEIEW